MSNIASVRKLFAEFYNGRDKQVAKKLLADNFVDHCASFSELQNKQSLVDWIDWIVGTFPDNAVELQELFEDASGSRVTACWRGTMTHTGDAIRGARAAGAQATIRGISIYGFNGEGLISDLWHQQDRLAMVEKIHGSIGASVESVSFPAVTVDQMRQVDKIMVEEIGVPVTMMMEHAARGIVDCATQILSGSVSGKKIIIFSHKGNNGGDGLAAARIFYNQGAQVQCVLTANEETLSKESKDQLSILRNMNIEVVSEAPDNLSVADLIVDSLVGYNLKGSLRQPLVAIVEQINKAGIPVLAVDIPSGVNGATGQAEAEAIHATHTVTLALPKVGLYTDSAKKYVGQLYVADLTIPKSVYKKAGMAENIPTLQRALVRAKI